uniref:SGNH domain-containing protein n=1 Tax=Panagrolaimus sp. PS1159 TaxID=55785 RepID=A0AC35EW56_9BILA
MGGAIPCSYSGKNTIHFGKRKAHYCEVAGMNPNGTLVGLLFGNSFSMNIITAVASNQLFKKVINLFISGSEFPAHDDFEEYLMEKMIKPIKPDVIFIVQKYVETHLYETPIDKIQEHEKFKHWTNILKVIENYTSAIIINKEQIKFPYDISTDFIRKKIYDLQVDSRIKNPPPSPNLEAWLAALKCSKCEFFGYREAFCDGEFCNVLDLATGLPLFRDTSHISLLGIRRIKPFIDKAIYKALKICV